MSVRLKISASAILLLSSPLTINAWSMRFMAKPLHAFTSKFKTLHTVEKPTLCARLIKNVNTFYQRYHIQAKLGFSGITSGLFYWYWQNPANNLQAKTDENSVGEQLFDAEINNPANVEKPVAEINDKKQNFKCSALNAYCANNLKLLSSYDFLKMAQHALYTYKELVPSTLTNSVSVQHVHPIIEKDSALPSPIVLQPLEFMLYSTAFESEKLKLLETPLDYNSKRPIENCADFLEIICLLAYKKDPRFNRASDIIIIDDHTNNIHSYLNALYPELCLSDNIFKGYNFAGQSYKIEIPESLRQSASGFTRVSALYFQKLVTGNLALKIECITVNKIIQHINLTNERVSLIDRFRQEAIKSINCYLGSTRIENSSSDYENTLELLEQAAMLPKGFVHVWRLIFPQLNFDSMCIEEVELVTGYIQELQANIFGYIGLAIAKSLGEQHTMLTNIHNLAINFHAIVWPILIR